MDHLGVLQQKDIFCARLNTTPSRRIWTGCDPEWSLEDAVPLPVIDSLFLGYAACSLVTVPTELLGFFTQVLILF